MTNLRSLYLLTLGVAMTVIGTGCESSNKLVSPQRWVVTVADEFDVGTSPNPDLWVIETGYGPDDIPPGWGNDEWQLYTDSPSNVRLEDGNLVITARCPEAPCGKRDGSVTSARLKTQGLFQQELGRFEARIQLPDGRGLWPAFWMLGANIDEVPWPGCGEIDVMENFGRDPGLVSGCLHGPGYSGGQCVSRETALRSDGTFSVARNVASTGDWSGNLVVPVAGTSRIIKQANIGKDVVEPNDEVTVSFAVRGELRGQTGAISAELLSEVDDGEPSKTEVLGDDPIVPTSEWVTYTYTVTAGDDVSDGLTLQLKAECDAVERCRVDIYFDDVTVTTGGVELTTNGGFESETTEGWTVGSFAEGFHIFAIEWDPSRIAFFVDGLNYGNVPTSDVVEQGDWVFNNEFFVLLNLAVGGDPVPSPNPSGAIFPAEMLVDYVRIFERAK